MSGEVMGFWQRIAIVAVLGALVAASGFVLQGQVATYATERLEAGAELSLPEQALIVAANFWARYGAFITGAFFVGLGAWAYLKRPRPAQF